MLTQWLRRLSTACTLFKFIMFFHILWIPVWIFHRLFPEIHFYVFFFGLLRTDWKKIKRNGVRAWYGSNKSTTNKWLIDQNQTFAVRKMKKKLARWMAIIFHIFFSYIFYLLLFCQHLKYVNRSITIYEYWCCEIQ